MYKKRFKKSVSFILLLCIVLSSVFVLSVFAAPVEIFDSDPVPVNKNANQTCKNFYQYLWNVRKSVDVISGAVSNKVIGIDGTKADGENDYHQYITDLFGVTPVIMGNHYGPDLSDDDIQVLAERYKKGAIPMFQIDPGDWSKLGTERQNGIVHYDKTNPDRDPEIYQSYIDERKVLGDLCKRLEAAGIEVYIIRLYIECNNSSKTGFYGINYIGYDSFKRVWKDTVEYLIDDVGVTGALFAYAPAGFRTSNNYYPGAEYVDINSPTVYANASDGEIFKDSDCADYDWMRYEKRPFAFSELAARSVLQPGSTRPIGDYANTLNSLLYAYPELSFFVLWYEDVFSIGPTTGSSTIGNYNGEYFIKNPRVINAENALDYRSKEQLKGTGIVTLYNKNGESVSLETGNYSLEQLKKMGVVLKDINALDVLFGCYVALYQTENCTGPANMYFGKTTDLKEVFSSVNSISVTKLSNVALEKGIYSDNGDRGAYRINNGKNDKFVTQAIAEDGSMNVIINLGSQYSIGQVSINHAGFYEDTTYNLRDFAIYVSEDDITYKTVYKTIANTATSSNVYFDAINAQFVKLKVIKSNSSSSIIEKNRVSISELMVYGTNEVELKTESLEDDSVKDESTNNSSSEDNNQGTTTSSNAQSSVDNNQSTTTSSNADSSVDNNQSTTTSSNVDSEVDNNQSTTTSSNADSSVDNNQSTTTSSNADSSVDNNQSTTTSSDVDSSFDNSQNSLSSNNNDSYTGIIGDSSFNNDSFNENQDIVGNTANGYGDNMTNNTETEISNNNNVQQKPPALPEYKIPKIYNYVWLMFCGVLVILIGAFWGVILLKLKKNKRKEKN